MMNKELEALNEIFNGMYNKQGFIKEFKAIEQALTPPTEQEVCKALGEWLNVKEKIRYKDNQFQYKLCNYNGKNCIWTPINITLYGKGKMPPHLITMIGGFYESEAQDV